MRNTANTELYTANSEKPGTMTKKNASSMTNSHRKFVSLHRQTMRACFRSAIQTCMIALA